MTVLNMDCIEGMRLFPDAYFDSIVTDPPYELGFMGKTWDASGIAYSVEMWTEALRVLKPGGHLLAFSGSRTYHRMVCAIEDAGFEIRDQIFWCFGSGFPKSHNLDNHRGILTCGCAVPYTHDGTSSNPEREVHSVQHADVPPAVDTGEGRGQILQPGVPEQSVSPAGWQQLPAAEVWFEQSSLEGRSDASQPQGELRAGALRAGASMGETDGAQGRLHHGASAGDGPVVRDATDARGDSTSHRPPADEQPAQQSRTVAGQSKPQTSGAWPICGGCGKPILPRGLGTALKPAHEPIVVARKPLAKGCTVAANVLAHGTGAINVDGCRVEATGESKSRAEEVSERLGYGATSIAAERGAFRGGDPSGRWPANLIHDGSDEVLAAFPQAPGQMATASTSDTQRAGQNVYGAMVRGSNGSEPRVELDKSAARFFYCAKASKADRSDGNTHPTVKPTDLMRYLCRLVTPPGGTVLDPFTGSGSTGKAARLEGFGFIGFELSEEYTRIATARIAGADS